MNPWPPQMLDHINGVKSDNRIANLRSADHAKNAQNLKRTANNTSGAIGVVWHKLGKKWQANIVVGKKTIYLGLFEDFNDAVAARRAAEKLYHPFAPDKRALKD